MSGTERAAARTLYDKIWDRHVVAQRGDRCLVHVDRHIVHDGSFHAFEKLKSRGIPVRRPKQTFGIPDHYVPTSGRSVAAVVDARIRAMLETFDGNMADHGITAFALGDARQGIAHVVGPELGLTLPGMLLVCGDSHTSTHGALGCLAFGIGQSENEHVLATQSLWQTRQKSMRIRIDGRLPPGTTAKDLILAVIAQIGAGGAIGHVIEYAGALIEALSIEERLTVCNMSIEAGARSGMIAPDERTFAYLEGRPYAPRGALWNAARAHWRTLRSDPDATFDREVAFDASRLEPMVTWGTSPQDAVPISGAVPDPEQMACSDRRRASRHAIEVMGLTPGRLLDGLPVDRVFIGSCTNGRIEDLRAAAGLLRGRRACVSTIVVPGSEQVRRQAEHERLDAVFREAGCDWRHAGCSMCVGINGDIGRAGERVASTSNRNFQGRQGPGVRTHLVSPATAAAAAITGRLTDVRKLEAAHG